MNENPFSFNLNKNLFIERLNEKIELINTFESIYMNNKIYLITGIRRSGKTSFMTDIANYLKLKKLNCNRA